MRRGLIAGLAIAGAVLTTTLVQAESTCNGKFPNPLTDFCYSCWEPFRMFGNKVLNANSQYDYDSGVPSTPCACMSKGQAKFGAPVSFWEGALMGEVVHAPGCAPTMGGLTLPLSSMPAGLAEGVNETFTDPTGGTGAGGTFRHVHMYRAPWMVLMEAILDNECLSQGTLDAVYVSEPDRSHVDVELANLLTPYAFAVGSLPALAVGPLDSVLTNLRQPRPEYFWRSGSGGHLYPLTGIVDTTLSNDQLGRLLIHRVMAKMHAVSLVMPWTWVGTGKAGLCGIYPQIIMDKRVKVQRIGYIPQTRKIAGECCNLLGTSTLLAEMGSEIPVYGKDTSYMIYRKRDCCQGAAVN